MVKKSLLGAILSAAMFTSAQQKADTSFAALRDAEARIQALQKKTFHSRSETERFEGNRELLHEWDRIVNDKRLLSYDFRLKDISIIRPPDNSFLLITWNIPKDDGSHTFFGYLLSSRAITRKKSLFRKETTLEFSSYKLLDRSPTIRSPENHVGGPDKWFGMLYTAVIPCDGYFTLIGWDGNTRLTTRKFVDVLSFRTNGDPVFGKDVFRIPRKNPRRYMFEYSSDVTMSVRYDERSNRIIYSHLASHRDDPLLEGQYQFYGPDGSYDALVMRKDKWEIEEDIDARNDRSKKDNEWNDPRRPGKKKQKKIMPDYRPN